MMTSLEQWRITDLPSSAFYIPNFISESEEADLLDFIQSQPRSKWHQLAHRRLQVYPSPLTPSNALIEAPLPVPLSRSIVPRLLELATPAVQKDNIINDSRQSTACLSEEKNRHAQACNSSSDAMGLFAESPHGQPNHCLVNEYQPGQGICAHEDGDAYHPIVCTVSLGSHCVLNISPKHDHHTGQKNHGSESDSDPGPSSHSDSVSDRKSASSQQQENGKHEKSWRVLQERRSLLITTNEMYTAYLHGIDPVTQDTNLDQVVNWHGLGNRDAFICRHNHSHSEDQLKDPNTKETSGSTPPEYSAIRGTRISLTYRDVKKVKTLGKVFPSLRISKPQ